jgi:hypothetical protein
MPVESLVPESEVHFFTEALDSLWLTYIAHEVAIVKEPQQVPVDTPAGSYVPGYGTPSDTSNFTLVPVSQTFLAILSPAKPDAKMSYLNQKLIPSDDIFMKVRADARDYILDGRRNLHVLFNNRAYNILSEDAPAHLLTSEFFVFRIALIK